MNPRCRLYTFSISHFSEKIRWTLDAAHLPYEEVRWTPFFHILPARLRGGRGTTVPILGTPEGHVQDSTRILHWLMQHHQPFALVPAAPELRKEVLDIEDRFDRVGTHVIRYAYSESLQHREDILSAWAVDASPLQRRILKATYPALRAGFEQLLQLSPAKVQASRGRISSELDWLEARIAGGQRFIVGKQLTMADITAAALLAPLACPAEHPVYNSEAYLRATASVREPFTPRPGLRWVRELYQQYRLPAGARKRVKS